MNDCKVLFDKKNIPKTPNELSNELKNFGYGYSNAVKKTIQSSKELDKGGEVFIKCASGILASFGMTRKGIFHSHLNETLSKCWDQIGSNLVNINQEILNSNLNRDRYLLEVSETTRRQLIKEIWSMTKAILPLTMTKSSYGLVGASKILFAALPEIVLPVDNVQWKLLFQTVDLGDVIRFMVEDIQKWESITEVKFNNLDFSRNMTTLPAVYNVVAMASRPKDR